MMKKLLPIALFSVATLAAATLISCAPKAPIREVPVYPSIISNGDFSNGISSWIVENGTYALDGNMSITPSGTYATVEQRHLSLQKDKVYSVGVNAKGDGTLKIDLHDGGGADIKSGFDTRFELKAESADYTFEFLCDGDYNNAAIRISVYGSCTLRSVSLNRVNLYGDITPPEFIGTNDVMLLPGYTFDMKKGVSVRDDVSGDLTAYYDIEVPSGVTVNGNTCDFSELGTYTFIYTCTDKEDNTARVERKVSVVNTFPKGTELIGNGSFDNGMEGWYADAYEGGAGTYKVVDGVLEITVTAIPKPGSNQPFPRLSYGLVGGLGTSQIIIEKGQTYRISFRIKADEQRTFGLLCAEVFKDKNEEGLWQEYFAQEDGAYGWGIRNRTAKTEWRTITVDFTMNGETNERGCLAFLFGDNGNMPKMTKLYLDDVSLKKIS